MPSSLTFNERPAAGDPSGLLVLHHGRGTDELDLLPLADVLDQRGLDVEYRESSAAHNIDPGDVPRAQAWLAATLGL